MRKVAKEKDLPVSCRMWLAGLFDGEGCINKYQNKGKNWFLNVSIVNTEYELIEPFLVFGGSIFKRKNQKRNPTFSYTLRGNISVLSFILTLMPYLRSNRRKKRMLELLLFKSRNLSDEHKRQYEIPLMEEKVKMIVNSIECGTAAP